MLKRKGYRGISFIEIMVVLSISSTLICGATPSLSQLLRKIDTSTAASALHTGLSATRMFAINEDKHIYICGSNANEGCDKYWNKNLLIFEDKNDNKEADLDEVIFSYPINYKRGQIKSRLGYGKEYTRFKSNGSASYSGSFLICPNNSKPEERKRLTWNIPGRVYFGIDANKDGIIEDVSSKEIDCS